MNHTQLLAEYTSETTYGDLPDDVTAMAKVAIRDALGVALFASPLPWTQKVATVAQQAGGQGRCGVWGRDWRLTAPYAAMVNATAAHGIEMDDRSSLLDVHNGAVAVPAAIASIEQAGGSGKDLITAVAVSYDVVYRIARATTPGLTRFYWNAIRTIFGGASAAARAFGLDPLQTRYAFGITGCMASGLWEHLNDPHGTMVKRFQGGGWPSQSGVTAALLGQQGFTGPKEILEGGYGLCVSFSTDAEPDLDALSHNLGKDYEILTWETKPYASVGHLHSSIDAVRELVAEHDIDRRRVERVEIATSSKVLRNSGGEMPKSIMAGQKMLEFVAAAAFFVNLADPASWTEDLVADPEVVDLASRVEATLSDEVEAIYKETNDHGGVLMTIVMDDGRRLTKRIRHARGTVGNPMSDEDLRAKFRLLARRTLDDAQIARLEAYVDGLESEETVDFGALCGPRA